MKKHGQTRDDTSPTSAGKTQPRDTRDTRDNRRIVVRRRLPGGLRVNVPSVEKVSWPGGFALSIIREHRTIYPCLLLRRLKQPRIEQGRVYGWRLELWDCDANKKRICPRQYLWLDVKTQEDADREFQRQDAQLRLKEADWQRTAAPSQITGQEEAVDRAQWEVLRQTFPKTIGLLEAKRRESLARQRAGLPADEARNAELDRQAAVACDIEIAKFLNTELQLPADNWRLSELIADAIRMRAKGQDAIDYDLAANWILGGYNKLLGSEYADAVAQAIGKSFKSEAERKRFTALVIQRRKRLGLQTLRKTGPRERSPL